jgi:hypothetical protein
MYKLYTQPASSHNTKKQALSNKRVFCCLRNPSEMKFAIFLLCLVSSFLINTSNSKVAGVASDTKVAGSTMKNLQDLFNMMLMQDMVAFRTTKAMDQQYRLPIPGQG